MKKILLLLLLMSIISVQAAPLFDVYISIPDNYKVVSPGDELLVSIKLLNIGSAGREDVFLEQWATDINEEIILKRTETVVVETQTSFVRTYDISDNTKPGKYYFHARITYGSGHQAVAEQSFEIIEKHIEKVAYYKFAGFVFGSIFLILLIYLLSRFKFECEVKHEK